MFHASPTLRLSVSGFLATAVAFGPGRMGYGLFLPQFRESFGLSTQSAGLVASSAFLAFLVALIAAGVLTRRFGPRVPLVAGGIARRDPRFAAKTLSLADRRSAGRSDAHHRRDH